MKNSKARNISSKSETCLQVNAFEELISSSKVLNMQIIELSSDGSLETYRVAHEDAVKITSASQSSRTKNHILAAIEQIERGIFYFVPGWIVEDDRIHTHQLTLKHFYENEFCGDF